MHLLICFAALLSGAAALIFETLWFEQLGLVVGNTVQSSTIVLAAFMGGLGLGYQLASRWLPRITHPARAYVGVELVAAISGAAIFVLLSHSSTTLMPMVAAVNNACGGCGVVFKPLLSLVILALPAVLLGMTLPLLVATTRVKSAVSTIYAANTLGAGFGSLALPALMGPDRGWNELVWLAIGLQIAAAIVAATAWQTRRADVAKPSRRPEHTAMKPLLSAAGVGFTVLACEVLWFRALQLEFSGTHDAFAIMLAIVLVGIAVGGLINRLLMGWFTPSPALTLSLLPLSILGGYLAWSRISPSDFQLSSLAISAALLMLPTCIVSGAVFPQLINSLSQNNGEATGQLGGFNSWGSAIGAVMAGLLVLPRLGMEVSLLVVVGIALTLSILWWMEERKFIASVIVIVASVGLMLAAIGVAKSKMNSTAAWFAERDQATVVIQKEGVAETLQLLQNQVGGQPWHSRVLTNSYSMSGTAPDSQRYMRLFAHLPLALHKQPKKALLISYGVGSTAQALVSSRSLDEIHVADPSAAMLDMSVAIHGVNNPLLDERVQVNLEDGRHFLATRQIQYDLITGEPPPPKIAGIKSLYSLEYFQLMRRRLSDTGLASYWLPIDQLNLSSAKAVLAAFCQAMESCSLWAGSNYNWIMIGGPGMAQYATNAAAERQWNHPLSALSLKIAGVETPQQLAATFIADAEQIAPWLADHPPLVDAYPRRLHSEKADDVELRLYSHWMDDIETEARFRASKWVQTHAPPVWRDTRSTWFALQPILNNQINLQTGARVALVRDMLNNSELEIPIYWLLGSDYFAQKISAQFVNKGNTPADVAYHLAVRALAERKYEAAGRLFELQQTLGTEVTPELTILSYCYAGQNDKAKSVKEKSMGSQPSISRCWN